MHWEEVWIGDSLGARLLRIALTPASWLYAAGWQSYLGIYQLGLKNAREPHCPVVCIGNLMAGGTGKSPVTLHVAHLLRDLGRDVVISCSGYGSPHSEAAAVAPDGTLSPREWGDEAAMIRWLHPDVPLIVGRRRVLAAELCHRRFPQAVMLMDDGFQHLPLKKHLSIVLDPASLNHRCLPAGPYREPRSNRSRADLVLPDRFTVSSDSFLTRPDGSSGALQGRADVLCALGRPRAFLDALTALGLEPRRVTLRPDHDPLDAVSLPRDAPLIVTAKDWVKLREREDVKSVDVRIAQQSVRIEPEAEFRAWLLTKLNGIDTQAD